MPLRATVGSVLSYAGEIANTRITEAGARRAGSIEDRSRKSVKNRSRRHYKRA
jgi:hypothetical protein